MLKLAIVGSVSILLSCGGYFGYHWNASRPVKNETAHAAQMELVKTDFISVAVFKRGKVDGYLTFRANIDLKDGNRLAEAGYLISDTIHRRLAIFTELFGDDFKPRDAKLLEAPLFSALSDRLGSGEVGSLTLTDIAYDRRIH